MSNVLERIGQTGLTLTNAVIGKTISLRDLAELLRLAKLGAAAMEVADKHMTYCDQKGLCENDCIWQDFCRLRKEGK